MVGNSDDKEEIKAAKEAAAKARGVKEVISQVKSRPKELSNETIFHSQVRNEREEKEKH